MNLLSRLRHTLTGLRHTILMLLDGIPVEDMRPALDGAYRSGYHDASLMEGTDARTNRRRARLPDPGPDGMQQRRTGRGAPDEPPPQQQPSAQPNSDV